MPQQISATFNLRYSTQAQSFTPSGPSAQFSAGVSASGGYTFAVNGGASILSRVLLPLNADYESGSGPGFEGFKFSGFPELTDSAGNPILDVNGLPLDFGKLTVLAIHVRAQDPDQPWGGTVKVRSTDDLVPGDAFGRNEIASETLLLYQETDGWTPGEFAQLFVEFVPTTAPTPAMVNAIVELLVIGLPTPATVPAFSAPPTISGTAEDGETLTATGGTVTGSPTPLVGYQWERCNTSGVFLLDIPGATGTAYIIQPADVGYTIRVREIATNSAGSASSRSLQTAVVTA